MLDIYKSSLSYPRFFERLDSLTQIFNILLCGQ